MKVKNNDTDIKTTIDAAVTSDRFSMHFLFDSLTATSKLLYIEHSKKLEKLFGASDSKKLLIGILRFAFLIEVVKTPKIETTKFESRWGQRLSGDDSRQANFQECIKIYENSIVQLIDQVEKNPENLNIISSFLKRTQVPHEIPLDYKNRITDGKIHITTNVGWYFGELIKKVTKSRDLLLDPKVNPHYELFARVYNKIQVKSYLTDRVLTGVHKTNREKRWETHPESVHFALRKTCHEVEYTLIKQIFSFDKIPSDLLAIYKKVEPVERLNSPFRCPITMEPLSFPQFEKEILSPVHGKSNFQVGHLNPLKSTNGDEMSGHTAKNISWISSSGNRIQGYLSLRETRNLIKRISENYKKFSS